MSQPAPRIYGYASSSSSRSVKSTEIQEALIRAKAEAIPDATWAHCRTDTGVSEPKVHFKDRPEAVKLMREIKPGDHLVIWRLDRLAETPYGIVHAMEWLVDHDINVHILEIGGLQADLNPAMGKMLVMILAEFACFLVDYPREAVREVIRWRKEHGLVYNKVPQLGKRRRYRYASRNGKRTRVAYDIWNAGECDVIREIWRRHELEGETLYSIAKDLKARDVRRWNGKPWVPDGCRRQPGTGKRYPLNSRTVQRAFWRYTAMLAQGCDLEDRVPAPQDVERARRRLNEYRLRWMKKGQPGRLPKEVRALLERNDLEALSEITPGSWGKWLYPGPGQ